MEHILICPTNLRNLRALQRFSSNSDLSRHFSNRSYKDARTLGARVSVASALSVCSRFASDFVFLSASVALW